mgnify:CR=1 FL=1
MPTIKIFYTDNISIKDKIDSFIKNTHTKLVEIIATDIHTCRTLIYPCSSYMVGNTKSKYNAYIQLNIAILPGRSSDLRKKLGRTLLHDLQKLCESNSVSIDFRVAVSETDTEFYFGL